MNAIITPESLKKEACQKEMNAVLVKYGFKLDPFFHMSAAGMQMGVNIIPANQVQVPVGKGRADA
jgi:hypothetical protein